MKHMQDVGFGGTLLWFTVHNIMSSCRQVGRLSLPPALLQAPGLQSPYLALFSLTSDASASRSMKSRGNLLRAVHQ